MSIKLDFLHLKKAALVLRAMNHKLRQQMIKLLDENEKMTVTEIYVKLRLEQSVASQHYAGLPAPAPAGRRLLAALLEALRHFPRS